MKMPAFKIRLRFDLNSAIGVVFALLVAGVIVDMSVTSPRVADLRELMETRHALRSQLGEAMGSKFRENDAARALGVDNIQIAITPSPEDPVSYLGHVIEQSGLTRLNLVSVEQDEGERLKRSEFSVRTAGSYDEIIDFVQRLETGQRLVTIDRFNFASHLVGDEIEGKFTLSIYDPKGR